MPCTGNGSSGIKVLAQFFQNWSGTRQVLIPTIFRPVNVQQIAAAIQEVERAGGAVKAVGSGWSYSDAAVDESVTHLMDLTSLNANLTGQNVTTPNTVIPFALQDNLWPEIQGNRHFVHVQAGITIYALNFLLDGLNPKLAMPTLGGANGQTLAGAISTGTHGADMNLPPIADAVKAIHLVGPGGQEWWIEPTNGITDPTRLGQTRDGVRLCNDISVVRDDQMFRAALVSLGRMGVIYSVVLEVVPAFRLAQRRVASKWSREAA